MTTNQFTIDTGSTIYVGSFLITQSAQQVNLPISVIIDSTGSEKGVATNGIYVIPSGGTITSILNAVTITGSTTIASMPAVTGSVTIASMPSITGSVAVVNALSVTVTGSTTIASMPAITGSVSVVNTPTITGSVSVINTPNVSVTNTPSVTISGTPSITGSVTFLGLYTTTQSTISAGSVGSIQVTSRGAVIVATGTDGFVVTGSTTIASMPSITGSVTIIGPLPTSSTQAITGSVSIISSPAITGSVTVISTPVVTGSVSLVVAPSFSSANATATTAGTGIVIPSTASNSIYITSLVISNGLTGGTIYLGYNTGATAPTTTAIYIPTLYFAANGGMVYPIPQQTPIKLPASTNFVFTVASTGTISILATYYVAA